MQITKAIGLAKVGTCRRRCYVWVLTWYPFLTGRIPFVDLHDSPWRELQFLLDDFRKRFLIPRIKNQICRTPFWIKSLMANCLWLPFGFLVAPKKIGTEKQAEVLLRILGPLRKPGEGLRRWNTGVYTIGSNGVKIKGDQGILVLRLYFYDVSPDRHHSSGFCQQQRIFQIRSQQDIEDLPPAPAEAPTQLQPNAYMARGRDMGKTWIFHEFCWLPWGWESDYQSLAGGSCFFCLASSFVCDKGVLFHHKNWTFDEFCHVSYMIIIWCYMFNSVMLF